MSCICTPITISEKPLIGSHNPHQKNDIYHSLEVLRAWPRRFKYNDLDFQTYIYIYNPAHGFEPSLRKYLSSSFPGVSWIDLRHRSARSLAGCRVSHGSTPKASHHPTCPNSLGPFDKRLKGNHLHIKNWWRKKAMTVIWFSSWVFLRFASLKLLLQYNFD